MSSIRLILFICLWVHCSSVVATDFIEINIDGIKGRALVNVRSFMSIEQQKNDTTLSAERIRKLVNKAHKEISRALQPFGYYKSDVKADLDKIVTGWRVTYQVDIGPPVIMNNIAVVITGEASEDPVFETYIQDFPLKSGVRLNHVEYENAKTILLNLASTRGYFDARLSRKEVQIDLKKNLANIELELTSGRRYSFGKVTYSQTIFDDSFLQRFLPFYKNQPYTLEKFNELEHSLKNSDYFDKVDVELLHDQSIDYVIPVEVRLITRKRTRYSAGVGYGTDTGARVKLGVERRRINRYGHKANTEVRESRILDEVNVSYVIPLKKPQSDQFVVGFTWKKEDVNDIEVLKKVVSFSHIHLSRHWQKTYYINYEQDDFDIGSASDKSTLVMPGLKWTRVKADDRIHTSYGNKVDIDIRGGSQTLGSTSSFLQARLGIKYISRFFDLGRVLARADIGYSDNMDFNELPPSVRFFAGGGQSVRGYGFNTLGPVSVDADGNSIVVGGEHLLVGSVELEFDYNESWSWATFYDIGNAMDQYGEDLNRGVGAGIRYRSVIGKFRLDLASALDKEGNPWRLHFSIGVDL